MKKTGNRLKSEEGASLAAALLFFVLCGVGASIILAAASSTAGKMGQLPAADQKRFAVESAAAFLRDELKDDKNVITVKEILVEDSRMSEPVSDQISFSLAGGSGEGRNSLLESYVRANYEPLGDAVPGGDGSEKDLSVSLNSGSGAGQEDLKKLKADIHVSMSSDYGITAVISDAETDTDHPEDLCRRKLTVPSKVQTDTDVSVEHNETKDADGNVIEEWTITTTTQTTTIRWERGTIEEMQEEMERRGQRMGKKLTSENGETLTELLISVLVIALGLSMFAAALTASRKMLILGTEKIETYYSERNDLEEEKSEKETWGTLTVEETGGKRVDIGSPSGENGTGTYPVKLYHADIDSKKIWRYVR